MLWDISLRSFNVWSYSFINLRDDFFAFKERLVGRILRIRLSRYHYSALSIEVTSTLVLI